MLTVLLADCVFVSVLLTRILVCVLLEDREGVDDLVCVLEFVLVGVPEDVCVRLARTIDTELVLLADWVCVDVSVVEELDVCVPVHEVLCV